MAWWRYIDSAPSLWNCCSKPCPPASSASQYWTTPKNPELLVSPCTWTLKIVSALWPPMVIGGRFGFSSKDFAPADVMAVYANPESPPPKDHFTVGIVDDVACLSLPAYPVEFDSAQRVNSSPYGSYANAPTLRSSIRLQATGHGAQAGNIRCALRSPADARPF